MQVSDLWHVARLLARQLWLAALPGSTGRLGGAAVVCVSLA